MKDPETRRGVRNLAMIGALYALLYFLWQWAARVDAETLREAMRGVIFIIGLAMLGWVMENGLRALKLHAGKDGIEIEAGGD